MHQRVDAGCGNFAQLFREIRAPGYTGSYSTLRDSLADQRPAKTPLARLEALILGVGDLAGSQGIRAADIGSASPYPGDVWHYARNRMIIAARMNGLDAIDGPFADFSDPDGYRAEARRAATLGAVGKWAIHPSQIALAHEVYSPAPSEVARARRIVDAVAAAEGGSPASRAATMTARDRPPPAESPATAIGVPSGTCVRSHR